MIERGVLQAICGGCTGCNTAPPRYFSGYFAGTSGSIRHNTLRLSPRIFLYRVGVSVSAELRGRRLAWSGQRNVANRIPVRLLKRGEPGALATLTIRRVEARCREFKSRRPHHKNHTHKTAETTVQITADAPSDTHTKERR